MPGQPKISAVVCTYNRERYLRRCILSLFNQTLDEKDFEIIVVDNGSRDATQKVCEEHTHKNNFKYVYEPNIGLSNARNAGWQNAHGSFVGYIDDDATADPGWLETALWCFNNISPVPEWVGGPIELEWETAEPDWITEDHRISLGEVNWGPVARFLTKNNERLGGGNSFYQRSVLNRMKGFDTRLGRKDKLLLSGEETQFQHRLRSDNGRLYYHPGIRIFHFVPKERVKPKYFYHRYYWGGRTDYIIRRTTKSIPYQPIAPNNSDGTSVMKRLLRNSLSAVGMSFSKGARIHGRIYISYVIGWLLQGIIARFQKLS